MGNVIFKSKTLFSLATGNQLINAFKAAVRCADTWEMVIKPELKSTVDLEVCKHDDAFEGRVIRRSKSLLHDVVLVIDSVDSPFGWESIISVNEVYHEYKIGVALYDRSRRILVGVCEDNPLAIEGDAYEKMRKSLTHLIEELTKQLEAIEEM